MNAFFKQKYMNALRSTVGYEYLDHLPKNVLALWTCFLIWSCQ